jgi:vitamin B12 transporter
MSWDGSYLNASKQSNYGVELETQYSKGNSSIKLNYTYTDGKTTSKYDGTGGFINKDTTYFNLWRIPKNAVHAQFSHNGKRWYTSAQVHLASKRYEYVWGASPTELSNYVLLDATVERKFGKHLKWFLQLNNLTNTKFEEQKGYNTKGFNWMTGFSWKF